MNQEVYNVVSEYDPTVYEFLSDGPKGLIRKVIYYQEIRKDIFNLSFGDWEAENERNNDRRRTNNLDRDKVLATVASTVIDFMSNHPNATIIVKGSTSSRTRLYQMGINANLPEIQRLFKIFGYFNDNWEPVEAGKNYIQFVLRLK